jgi:hypothetical protein
MAKNPEFKAPQDVHVKQPESVGLFGEEPVKPDSTPAPQIQWLEIPILAHGASAFHPFTGEPVWLTPDGTTEYLAVWRVTREYRDGRFQPVGFWAVRNGGGQRVPFEPIGYRRYEEPIFVPKKRV